MAVSPPPLPQSSIQLYTHATQSTSPAAALNDDPSGDVIIPQKVYPSQTTGFTASEPISFTRHGALGVSLEASLQPDFALRDYTLKNTGMSDGAISSPLSTTSAKITLRLQVL